MQTSRLYVNVTTRHFTLSPANNRRLGYRRTSVEHGNTVFGAPLNGTDLFSKFGAKPSQCQGDKAFDAKASEKHDRYESGEGRRLGCLSVQSVWRPVPRKQLLELTDRSVGDAGQDVGKPSSGSMSLALMISVAMNAARSAALFVRQIRPSSRNDVKPFQRSRM